MAIPWNRTKNYHGYNKKFHGNLFIRPDLGCGNTVCGENDASGVSAPKVLAEHWYNNTCITAGTPYSGACDAPDPKSSTSMQYSGNTFMTPSGKPDDLRISCDGAVPPPPPPPPPKCAKNQTQCDAGWHCATCKVGASNPTDCLSCKGGFHFKREYWDCTGECRKTNGFYEAGTSTAVDASGGSISFADWQEKGWDAGSVVLKMPDAEGIVAMARKLLQF